MDLLPAIDLKNGMCVRLKRGDMNQTTVFSDSPAKQAQDFASQGAKWLHMVDLDGAFAGKSVNGDAVKDVLKTVKMKIELGGGIRSFEAIESWLSAGVHRVILGTIALKNPDFVIQACRSFKDRIAVGIDARDSFVAVEGWAETSSVRDVDLAEKFKKAGVSAIIYTDISRDGVLMGANFKATADFALKTDIPVIVSGGVASLDDVRTCRSLAGKNIAGLIVGRALYDGKFTVKEALSVLKGEKE